MKSRLSVCLAFVLLMAAYAVAADGPSTGTWHSVRRHTGNTGPGQMVLSPVDGGISLQEDGSQSSAAKYGEKAAYRDSGFTVTMMRVDDHTLQCTFSQGGKIRAIETGIVSADGKHYTRIQELVGTSQKISMEFEYDRIGPVPAGDAFFGTWQQLPRTDAVAAPGRTLSASGNPNAK